MSNHLKTYEKELLCENQEKSEVIDRLSRYFSSDLIWLLAYSIWHYS